MRNLPEQMVTLTLVSNKQDEIVERTESFLLERVENNTHYVINQEGITRSFVAFTSEITSMERIANIRYENSDTDDYAELVQSILFADMVKDIEQLGLEVSRKFDEITNHCPETVSSLWEQLAVHVLPQEQETKTDKELLVDNAIIKHGLESHVLKNGWESTRNTVGILFSSHQSVIDIMNRLVVLEDNPTINIVRTETSECLQENV